MNLSPRVFRYGFVGLAIAAVVVSALVRMQNLGYIALFFGLGFVAIGITHVVLHWRLSGARPLACKKASTAFGYCRRFSKNWARR